MEITLPSGRKIGDGHAPFIIAEVGSNWETLDDCLYSIRQAKGAGADSVKFQLFNAAALYGPTSMVISMAGVMGMVNLGAKINQSALPIEWLPKLKYEADKVGIEFMCTAFSPELYDVVDPYVNIHKVASAEMTHVRILEKVRSLGKPVILSTGASGEKDIEQAVTYLDKNSTVLMYCVAAYPARVVKLEEIERIMELYGSIVGYSDHTTDVLEIPYSATRVYGAAILEKHVSFIDADTPDKPHSLTMDEFKAMVDHIRGRPQHEIYVDNGESPMRLKHNRRIIATQDIKPGDELKEGKNIGIFRSLKDDAKGLSPFLINKVNGKIASVQIRAGDGIGPNDFQC